MRLVGRAVAAKLTVWLGLAKVRSSVRPCTRVACGSRAVCDRDRRCLVLLRQRGQGKAVGLCELKSLSLSSLCCTSAFGHCSGKLLFPGTVEDTVHLWLHQKNKHRLFLFSGCDCGILISLNCSHPAASDHQQQVACWSPLHHRRLIK